MKISRRTFLGLSAMFPAAALVPSPSPASGPVFRTLGRTGLKVSEVGMGVMITSDPDIVRAALDAGVNYFDTARSYMGGRNEAILGKGLAGRRPEAIVATKCHHLGLKKKVLASVDESLHTLGIEQIDILQLHGLRSRRSVLLEEHLEALEELKKTGKIRFAGVTTHDNMVEVMEAAVEAGVYDVVLTSFNFNSPKRVIETVEKTAAAGLGVVAMKIMSGGYRGERIPGLNPFQSALRWALHHKAVSTTIPSMATIEQMQQNTAVMGSVSSLRDDLSLAMYASLTAGRYCRACGSCRGQCRLGADIPAAMRGVMYLEGYGEPELARETLSEGLLPCGDCGGCTVSCRYGLDVGGRMSAAQRIAGDAVA